MPSRRTACEKSVSLALSASEITHGRCSNGGKKSGGTVVVVVHAVAVRLSRSSRGRWWVLRLVASPCESDEQSNEHEEEHHTECYGDGDEDDHADRKMICSEGDD